MTDPLAFWMPVLPRRVLSSNASGEERNRWTVSAAKIAMSDATEEALKEFMPLPFFARVRMYITGHIAVNKQPNLEDCLRCLAEYLLEPWLGKKRKDGTRDAPTCRCYRAIDPANLGGDVTKKIPDKLEELGVITRDDYRYVAGIYYSIEAETEIAAEGIAVVVEPLEP